MGSLAAKEVARKKLIKKNQKAVYDLKVALAKQRMSEPTYNWSYIYLVRCNEFYKIGYAYDVDSRFDSFKSSNPYEVSLEFALKVSNAKELERKLHRQYQEKRHKREWFKLNYEDILEIKRFCEEYDKKNK